MSLTSSQSSIQRHFSQFVFLLLISALTFAVYYRGLFGNFIFDDNPNILLNKWIAISQLNFENLKNASLSGEAGILKRPLAMLSFAINHYFHGYNPYYFKLTNLAIHLLNGIALFYFTKLLASVFFHTQEQKAATLFSALCTAIWLLHPFNLTPVLYVVQRMTSLSSLFVLLGLCAYLAGRIRLHTQRKYGWYLIASCYLIYLPLAALTKESGCLLVIYAGLIEYCLPRDFSEARATRKKIAILHTVTVIIPALAALSIMLMAPGKLFDPYDYRNFNLQQRLLTESRVIWFYAAQICIPNINEMALYHDDFQLSSSILAPAQTLFAIFGLLAASLLALRRFNRILSFSILFFLSSHLIESTVLPLELVFEHRNYLASYGLLFGLMYLLVVYRSTRLAKFRLIAAVLITLVFAAFTANRAYNWRSNFEMARVDARNHPNSARSNAEVAEVLYKFSVTESNPELRETYFELSKQYFENAVNSSPENISGLLNLIHLYGQHKKPIDELIYSKLSVRLKQYEIPASIAEIVYAMIECRRSTQCVWDDKKLFDTLVVMLDNPKVKKKRLGSALNILSVYQNNVFHNVDLTIYYLNRSIEADPAAYEYLVTLVKYLLAVNRDTEAKAAFELLKQRDKYGVLKAEISAIERIFISRAK